MRNMSAENVPPPPSSFSARPKVVGIDWSILSVVESNQRVEIEEPLAEISLDTATKDGRETVKFLCNKNQLQDFHWKVKEAYNFLQKMAQLKKPTK